MALSVSPAIKVFALLGIVVALVMGGALFVMGGSQEVSDTEPLALPSKKAKVVDAPALAKKTAAASNARVKKVTPAAAPAAAKPKVGAAKPKAKSKAKAKPAKKSVPAVAKNGLPTSIMRALAANDVVVVSLYGGDWKIDPLAHDEAAAGARAAQAGFVGLDVTKAGAAAEALMLKYDTIFRAPAILIFRSGGELALQLDGFRDRDTVAQAATNSRP